MSYADSSKYHDEERSASDPSGKTDFIQPEFNQNRQQEREAMSGDPTQSVPDRHGSYGGTAVPGDTTSSDTLIGGSRVDPSSRTGIGAGQSYGRDVQTSSGDVTQSAPDSHGSYGTTGVPGNTTSDRTIGQAYDRDTSTTGTGKPGLGQRLMGGVEKMAGMATGNREHAERDEDRQTGA